ncbi:MAG TPA: hypothetical protein VMN60_06540 [Longimicrobiales bacterium]|nr:hypothetical protein [Longimicrobiales bacterium]
MNTALLLLAIAGFSAIALRALSALFATVRVGIDVFLARDAAATRRQRGDLTGLADANAARATARRRRYIALGFLSLWAGLLVVPALTPWPRALYAAYSALWLLPRRRLLARPR